MIIYTITESPLPLIDPQGGDNPSNQFPIHHPKPIHPNSGSEIEIERSDEDNEDTDSTESQDVSIIHSATIVIKKLVCVVKSFNYSNKNCVRDILNTDIERKPEYFL